MMVLLYNVGIFSYQLLIQIASLWNSKAKQWIDGQSQTFKHLSKQTFYHPYWFHCASVGEFEQALPLIQEIKKCKVEATFLVTFFSPSGFHFAIKKYPEFIISYLPLDTKKNVHEFLNLVKPCAAFFVKYEFWYHYLQGLKNQSIPSFLVSGIFRKDQLFFKWYGNFYRSVLSCFSYLFLQNEESKRLLQGIEINNTEVFGDTRFDRVNELRAQTIHDDIITDFTSNEKVFIAGSVWQSDENVLQQLIDSLPIDWKIIIVPHEIAYYNTAWIKEPFTKYSTYKKSTSRIMLLDTLGLLSRIYKFASLAYVGGGYGKGIHNILEPAVNEIPVFIGPNHTKFNEAIEMIERGLVFDTQKKESISTLDKLLNNTKVYEAFRDKNRHYFALHANVSARIVVLLQDKKWL